MPPGSSAQLLDDEIDAAGRAEHASDCGDDSVRPEPTIDEPADETPYGNARDEVSDGGPTRVGTGRTGLLGCLVTGHDAVTISACREHPCIDPRVLIARGFASGRGSINRRATTLLLRGVAEG